MRPWPWHLTWGPEHVPRAAADLLSSDLGMAQLVCERDHRWAPCPCFPPSPLPQPLGCHSPSSCFFALREQMFMQILASSESARGRVCMCASQCVFVCSWCVHVCEAASKLGPVDLSAAGPPGRGHPASLLLVTLSAGQKDHAAWTLPAGGLGPCPHGPVCGREVIGLCSWDLPGQRPRRRTKGEGAGQQAGAGCQESAVLQIPACALGRSPPREAMALRKSWPEES